MTVVRILKKVLIRCDSYGSDDDWPGSSVTL